MLNTADICFTSQTFPDLFHTQPYNTLRLRPRPLFPIRYRADTCATVFVLYTHRVVKYKWSNRWVLRLFVCMPQFTLLILDIWKRRKNDMSFYVIVKIRNIRRQVHTRVPLSYCIPSNYCHCKWNKLLLLIFLSDNIVHLIIRCYILWI